MVTKPVHRVTQISLWIPVLKKSPLKASFVTLETKTQSPHTPDASFGTPDTSFFR